MTVLDASPSRERLGRVVEMLRGAGVDPGVRRQPRRPRDRRPVAVRPLPAPRAEDETVA